MIFVAILGLVLTVAKGEEIHANPPHCTNVTKGTDYVYHYRFDYPVAYIHPGTKEVYQPLYCINPPAVALGSTVVCDWAAPPQVQFTLGDDHMHVVRQDPTGQFAGNAVIWTYQLCSHNHLLPAPYKHLRVNPKKCALGESLSKSAEPNNVDVRQGPSGQFPATRSSRPAS